MPEMSPLDWLMPATKPAPVKPGGAKRSARRLTAIIRRKSRSLVLLEHALELQAIFDKEIAARGKLLRELEKLQREEERLKLQRQDWKRRMAVRNQALTALNRRVTKLRAQLRADD